MIEANSIEHWTKIGNGVSCSAQEKDNKKKLLKKRVAREKKSELGFPV